MNPIIFPMPGNESLATRLDGALGAESGSLDLRRFPDGESYVRLMNPVRGRDVVFVCTLDRPDEKIMPLYLAASIARELGARRVGVVAPYLSYMRQDARFHDGEGTSSMHFARFVSGFCDWLVTVDPHLHRHFRLGEVYNIPTRVVHAAPAIASWVKQHIAQPCVIGPDAESEQWAGAVARAVGCPHSVLAKTRSGDREVCVTPLAQNFARGATPVLVDDIASTGQTLIAAIGRLQEAGLPPPVCVVVHPVFADAAFDDVLQAGAGAIVSCNTITHSSNAIDLTEPLAAAVADFLAEPPMER